GHGRAAERFGGAEHPELPPGTGDLPDADQRRRAERAPGTGGPRRALRVVCSDLLRDPVTHVDRRRLFSTLRTAPLAALLALLVGLAPRATGWDLPPGSPYPKAHRLAILEDREVAESSGIMLARMQASGTDEL